MSTNGRTPASKLFDLFRDRETFQVLDRDGNPAMVDGQAATVTLRALDWQENSLVIKKMEYARMRVRIEMEKNGDRQMIADQLSQLNADQVADIVLGIERPIASNVADLAPNGVSGDTAEAEEQAKKKEEEAIKKWETDRRAELKAMELDELRELLVRRQESLFVNARAAQDYINEALVLMVIDENGESVFSADEKATNYIGAIMPELRNQLIKFREEFVNKRGEKQIRKAAETTGFLPSGESPKPDTDIPGATTETPRRSRRTPSPSTPVATG